MAKIKYDIVRIFYGLLIVFIPLLLASVVFHIKIPFWVIAITMFIGGGFLGTKIYYIIHRPKVIVKDVVAHSDRKFCISFFIGYNHSSYTIFALDCETQFDVKLFLNEKTKSSMERLLNTKKHIKNLLFLFKEEIITGYVGERDVKKYLYRYDAVVKAERESLVFKYSKSNCSAEENY